MGREGLPTSVTHRAEYMAYLRAARNPTKLPPGLREQFASADSRLDLFRLWLQKGRDFNQVQIEMTRRSTQQQRATNRNQAMSRAQLLQDSRYSEADVDALIARRTAENAFIPDPNFPDRVDLRQYVIHQETTSEEVRSRENTQTMHATTRVTHDEALPMLEDGNEFSANNTPTIHGLNSELSGTPFAPATAPGTTEPSAKAKGKGKGRAKAKPKAKPGANGEDGAGSEDAGGPPPDKPSSPLEKAKLLKTKVSLGQNLTSMFKEGNR